MRNSTGAKGVIFKHFWLGNYFAFAPLEKFLATPLPKILFIAPTIITKLLFYLKCHNTTLTGYVTVCYALLGLLGQL